MFIQLDQAPLQRPRINTRLRIEISPAFRPLLEPHRYKGAAGGRGAGKSHFFAEQIVRHCIQYPGTRAVCIREVQKSLEQSSKRTIEDKISRLDVGRGFVIRDAYIGTPGNGIIIFQGMQNHTAETIKSLEGYTIGWVDEAQKLSQRSLDLLYPTFRHEDSELWFSWNPISPSDPVEKFFRQNADDPDFLLVEVDYTDNYWFTEVSQRDMERDRRRDPEKYKHVWLGHYQRKSEARVFHNWKIEEFPSPQNSQDWVDINQQPRFYFGCDWGFSVDPTVLVRCFVVDRTLYVDYEAWMIKCELDRTPQLFATIPESGKWPIVADSSNPQSISYLRRHGYPRIMPAVKGVGSVEEGVEFLKNYDIIVHPRCRHVADELASYSYEIDQHTEEVLPRLADRKNHTIDALRYAVEAVRRAYGPAGAGRY